ncbi:restriction endonuclease subunit S [Ralstonia solanacearum]|uniref:restriction endonuclease subunit S n=1 Tax=Ralstonia solanacearum TaxID=305 RepID=UPI0007C8B00C|nr:restriction endonuclease subunit S [Ralstonia solanacearum]OAI58218.1 hypothetical protein RSP597_25555 [Ralstonia solanacearum]
MKLMKLTDEFELASAASNGVARLRDLILSLAVQGKLVPQESRDEPASFLVGDIQKKKEALIAKGAIRQGKSSPPISDGEKPFDLPRSWEWIRLGDLLSKLGAGSTPLGGKEVYVSSGVKFLRSQNVWNDGLRREGTAFITHETHARMGGTVVLPGDLLFNITGASIGRCAVVPRDFDEANVSQHVAIVRSLVGRMTPYLHLVLISRYVQQTVMDVQVGVSREGLSMSKLGLFLIPLPPLEEQDRIVAKVDDLMRLCDALEEQGRLEVEQHERLVTTLFEALTTSESPHALAENWARVAAHFDLLLDRPEAIDAFEQMILQLAARGLLVRQDSTDEPAGRLLEQIRQGAVDGKGARHGKAISPIVLGEQAFSLPVGWEWARLYQLGECVTGGTPPKSNPEFFNGDVPFVKPGNLRNGDVIYEGETLSRDGAQKVGMLSAPSVLMVCIGGSIGKSALAIKDCSFNQQINAIKPVVPAMARYLAVVMSAAFFQSAVIKMAGHGTLPIISKGKWEKLPIPVPPLGEQVRIVARVEELLNLCAALRERLVDRQGCHIRLAEALVEQTAAASPDEGTLELAA